MGGPSPEEDSPEDERQADDQIARPRWAIDEARHFEQDVKPEMERDGNDERASPVGGLPDEDRENDHGRVGDHEATNRLAHIRAVGPVGEMPEFPEYPNREVTPASRQRPHGI